MGGRGLGGGGRDGAGVSWCFQIILILNYSHLENHKVSFNHTFAGPGLTIGS